MSKTAYASFCVSQLIIIAFMLYAAVAITVFRFRNPHLTETELFLNIPEALLWGKPETE